jgi:hypothetical protein
MKTVLTTDALLMVQVLILVARAAVTALTPESQLALAASRSGRMALHVVCAWHDHRYSWHWNGVLRELTCG